MMLTDLADVVRAARLPCVEVDGWRVRTRSGSPAGYNHDCPDHVMVHHTASRPVTDGRPDVFYIVNAKTAPICNLYVDRKGQVWVVAAGPSNTNGKGSAPWTTRVPDNMMNAHAIGIECANDGVGEQWPTVQQTAIVRLCAALCVAYGISVYNVRAHHEWAPSRKIDPAGPSAWASGSSSWDMERFRADVGRAVVPTPKPPTTPSEDDDMRQFQPDDGDLAVFAVSGLSATWVRDGETRDALAFLGAGLPVRVPRSVLSALVLDGPLPKYAAGEARPKTVAADFAAHRP
jgi:N-acetylmuramoyl-L-alanine amidase